MGTFRFTPAGTGTVWARLPLVAARRIVRAGTVCMRWVALPVEALAARPMQCYRRLEFGHSSSGAREWPSPRAALGAATCRTWHGGASRYRGVLFVRPAVCRRGIVWGGELVPAPPRRGVGRSVERPWKRRRVFLLGCRPSPFLLEFRVELTGLQSLRQRLCPPRRERSPWR